MPDSAILSNFPDLCRICTKMHLIDGVSIFYSLNELWIGSEFQTFPKVIGQFQYNLVCIDATFL